MPIRIKTKDGVIVESDPTAIKRDGSQAPTANIPWNSKKITGLAGGTDPNDAINLGQLTSHTTDATIHFTEGSIDHTNILNIGTNSHAQIDTHIANTANPHSVDIDDVTPTTTKGDILVEDGSNVVRLGVGSNDQVLTADSSTATGLKWADAAGSADFEAAQHILANQIFA